PRPRTAPACTPCPRLRRGRTAPPRASPPPSPPAAPASPAVGRARAGRRGNRSPRRTPAAAGTPRRTRASRRAAPRGGDDVRVHGAAVVVAVRVDFHVHGPQAEAVEQRLVVRGVRVAGGQQLLAVEDRVGA